MRKTVLMMLIALTLLGISANVMDEKAYGQDAVSRIDAILSPEQIVISDATYRITAEAGFYANDGKTLVEFSSFKVGDAVDFTLDSKGDIIELIKRAER